MKVKNILFVFLGILSFISVIWLGKMPAMSLLVTPTNSAELNVVSTEGVSSQAVREFINYPVSLSTLPPQSEQRFPEAIAILQQLELDYAERGNELGQARVLGNLSLVYQAIGNWSQAREAIAKSINLLQTDGNTQENTHLLAQALNVRGKLELAVGEPEQALDTWKQAAALYQKIGDITGVTRSQINQAQAQRRLGLYHQAISTLKQVNLTLEQQPDTLLKAQGLLSLGNTLRVVGDFERSQQVLEQSLAIAQKLEAPDIVASILLSLGNTARLQQKRSPALEFYKQAVSASPSPQLQIQGQLNQFSLLVDRNQLPLALPLLPQIQSSLTELPLGRISVNARINLAESLMQMQRQNKRSRPLPIPGYSEIAQLLATSVQQAENLGDQRTLAYALGHLGELYEQNQQWDHAQQLTEKALNLAQSIQASDIAYRWQWQLGRISKAQGQDESAIAAYSQAINTLQSLRSDLVAISSEVQFSFREKVEPIYRELVGLLLKPGTPIEPAKLSKAREVMEYLQLAELDNFFQDACLDAKPVQIDQVDPQAAVLYEVTLSDRLEVIAALPGQPLRHYTTAISQEQVEKTVEEIKTTLTLVQAKKLSPEFFELSQEVYNWLIQPIEADLAKSRVKTLVFVLDGAMRNIPMATLYDGKQYLVEKYSIALTPGLHLLEPKPLVEQKFKIFAAGLSEARQGFSALPGVEVELQNISQELPTDILLNQSFTASNFEANIDQLSAPVVHLATHGQFSSKAADTYILTWDEKINAQELDRFLRAGSQQSRPIELLVLSACQTAKGDNRAALGLAGVAVRAGARSTLASLWYVSDLATSELMVRFYDELVHKQVTKAEALRQAQLTLLQNPKFSHPYFWSAFLIVGNWL